MSSSPKGRPRSFPHRFGRKLPGARFNAWVVGVLVAIVAPAVVLGALAGGVFEIEGNLLSGDEGGFDWVQGTGGTGVLSSIPPGDPIVARTEHKIDFTKNDDENGFFTGVKVFQDPETWGWKAKSSPPKDDINNGTVHFFKDNGDWWVAVSGDRRSINGTSYIDFEFLQASLVTTDGGFASDGTDGGRTNGDFLLTIELTKGGGQADFFAQIWRQVDGEWTYKDTTVAIGTDAFVSANISSTVDVPYGAFGSATYDINQFGEAAANLTKIIGIDDCRNIETIFIRTKSSASPSAELKDFIEPFAPDFCLDDEPPTISGVGDDKTIECTEPVVFSDPTAADNCELVSFTFEDEETPGRCPQEKSVTRTWTAVDHCGKVTTASQTITVEDNGAPTISGVGDDKTIECTEALVFSTPTASDLCDPAPSLTHEDKETPGRCPQEKSVTRTWTAKDACGNTSTDSQTIHVVDTGAPTISGVGDDKTIECTEALVFSTPTASDLCDPAPSLTHDDKETPGRCPQEKSVTRTWTAKDACGNTTTASQTITVEDNGAPTISGVGDDKTIECTEAIVFSTPSASDDCDPSPSLTHEDTETPGACPQEKTVTRTWTAKDACGNTSTASQTITVEDNGAPTISGVGDDMTIECPEKPVFSTPTASDDCDPSPTLTYEDVEEPGECPVLTVVTRTWTAKDACGNTSTASQKITIQDTQPPVFVQCFANKTVECEGEVVFDPPEVTDDCSGGAKAVQVGPDNVEPGPGANDVTITRTWKAVDLCNNETTITCSQSIIVDCPDEACSFTQGFWGNAGGKFDGETTLEILERLLAVDLVVGSSGRSIRIPGGVNAAASALCIVERLPAGTTPKRLPGGLGDATLDPVTCQTTGSKTLPEDDEGRFQNILLGQTIALSLNVRYDPNLKAIPLSASFCTDRGMVSIPENVLTALGSNKTVAGLLELANKALGGQPISPASVSEVNNAVDQINRGFDECASVVECSAFTVSLSTVGGALNGPQSVSGDQFLQTAPNAPEEYDLGQNYPNPFNPNTTIQLTVPLATAWSLEIYNVAGQLVRRFEGSTAGPSFVSVDWDGRSYTGEPVSSGIYLYRMKAGSFKQVRKMVLLK